MSDVIAAIATGKAPCAIGILRLSGPGCAEVAGRVFELHCGLPLQAAPTHKLMLGRLRDRRGRVIDEAMAVRRLGFYARCGAVDTGWTEHLFDAWFRVLVLPAKGETLDAETANKELADCYSRVMGADKWRRYVRLYRPDGTEEKF